MYVVNNTLKDVHFKNEYFDSKALVYPDHYGFNLKFYILFQDNTKEIVWQKTTLNQHFHQASASHIVIFTNILLTCSI